MFTVVKGTNADPDKHAPLWALITLGALVAAGGIAALRWPQKWERTMRATNVWVFGEDRTDRWHGKAGSRRSQSQVRFLGGFAVFWGLLLIGGSLFF